MILFLGNKLLKVIMESQIKDYPLVENYLLKDSITKVKLFIV